jgi:hypothetical protein
LIPANYGGTEVKKVVAVLGTVALTLLISTGAFAARGC